MAAPRWKTAIENALKSEPKSNAYQLATAIISTSTSPNTTVPYVRTLIHRDFLFFPQSTAPSPLLLTTTDVRTPKARQLSQNPSVELAWWFAGVQEQYRIKGKAWVLPSKESAELDQAGLDARDVGDSTKAVIQATAAALLKAFPAARLSGGDGSFDWEAKREEVYESMSGHMRASWARPVPGSRLEGGYEAANAWPEKLRKLDEIEEGEGKEGERERERERQEVLYALKNFALVVIEPEEVDKVELGVMPNQRTAYRYVGGQWLEEIVVP